MSKGEVVQYRKDVVSFVQDITIEWKKATDHILSVSKKLHTLQSSAHGDKSTLDTKEKWSQVRDYLINNNIMSQTVISQLCRIGENNLLFQHKESLPSAYNTLYELARVPDEELEEMFEQKLITPFTKQDDVKKLKLVGSSSTSDDDSNEVEVEYIVDPYKKGVTILFKDGDVLKKYQQIETIINELRTKMKFSKIEYSGTLRKKIEGD